MFHIKYALYFDENIRKEEFDRKHVESHLNGEIIREIFTKGTNLVGSHDKTLVEKFNNHYTNLDKRIEDKTKGYFITLDRGIYTQIWLDLLTKNNFKLNLIEIRLPKKVWTQKNKHWYWDNLQPRDIPKVRNKISEEILKEMR